MERKQVLTVSVDRETVDAVKQLALTNYEGNKSQAVRRLIKLGALVARANDADAPTAQREKR
jgi:hypothetical protein